MGTARHSKKNSPYLIALLLLPLAWGLLVLYSSDACAISFILSSGKDINAPLCVDDRIEVYVNGAPVFVDATNAGCKGTINISAEDGDLIEIDAIDWCGSCRSISPVYIHRADCDSYDIITEGRDDGCHGFPSSTEPFFTATYIVDMKWLACPDIKVTQMQCARAGGASIKILDAKNQVITPDSSDFPAEAIALNKADPEKVIFALDDAQPTPESSVSYTATGWVKLSQEQEYSKLYKDKEITFKAGERAVTVTYAPSDIKLPGKVAKSDEVFWTFLNGSEDVASCSVPKELYFVVRKGNIMYGNPRKEILDIACDIAGGLKKDHEIRVALETGLYDLYKFPSRSYNTPGHFNTLFLPAAGTFDLTGFLQANTADCADMSTMHKLACTALGINQELLRIWKLAVFTKNGLGPIVVACNCLGTFSKAGTLTFNDYWHQISFSPIENKIYDPLMQFDDGAGVFKCTGGLTKWNYKKLFENPLFIFDSQIGLLEVK